jgi:hypothetical protein
MGAGAESLEGRTLDLGLESRLRLPLAFLEREAFPLAIGVIYALVLLLAIPGMLVQDSWSTLVSGREIVQGGLPHHETLTVMAHGVRWIDQQWLAQLTFYELFRAGGYRLIVFAHLVLIASAFALALVAARRRGGSPVAVLGAGVLCGAVAPWGWQLRAQSFAPLLFVLVLALLVADGRRRSPRVFLVLPALALWANLHGSVVLGALLVAAYGVVLALGGRDQGTGAALAVLAPLCVVASPYGFSLVGYYRHLLINPPFGRIVNEWTAPTPSGLTAVFYLLAFVAVWAVGRRGSALTLFERLALLVTLAAALHATRNIIWFGLTALVLLPVLVQEEDASRAGAHPAARLGLSATLLAVLVVGVAIAAAQPLRWYQRLWPDDKALAAVESATRHPGTRVFASDRLADWLLWRDPALRGRIAYDIRFELNTARQVRRLQRFFSRVGDNWRAAARGYSVLVLDHHDYKSLHKSLTRTGSIRLIYRERNAAVFVRRPR